jgi:ankyrin repeat protein
MSSKEPSNFDVRRLNEGLYEAAFRCSTDGAKRLLEVGADVNARCGIYGTTPLHAATVAGCADVVELLIKAGADVNSRDNLGKIPLHYAAIKGNVEIIKRLIAAGSDVNAEENEDGKTPLHTALIMTKEEAALELINAGADIAKADRQGRTPLHLAARKCLVRVVEELLRRGAPVNARDADGNTPLHHAVEYCDDYILRKKIISLLLDSGADVEIRNKKGLTPLDYKTFDGTYEIEVLLRFLRNLSKTLDRYLRKLQRSNKQEEVDADKAVSKAKIKVAVKLKRVGGYVDYEARVGDYVMISGFTVDGRDEVREIIRRALRAEKPLPRRAEEVAVNVARQVLLWIEVHKVEGAAAGVTVDLGEYSDITVHTALYYEAYKGWTAELSAVLDGFDGYTTDARHKIVEKVKLGKELDSKTNLLLKKLLKVARRAYNIYIERGKISYGHYDEDDDDDNDDDGDDTGLKILSP